MQLFSLGLSLLLSIASFLFPSEFRQQETARPGQIVTMYDSENDRTTVRLSLVQISGAKAQYHSAHISPSFSYPGRANRRPEAVEFEMQTVVKTKLKIDLYVVFVVDGETIFLSSKRSAIKRPVAGKRWIGERLVFRMPYETLMKIGGAKTVEIKMDSVRFPLTEAVLEHVREFARLVEGREGERNPLECAGLTALWFADDSGIALLNTS